MRLLYAEDERALSEAVSDILTYHKYSVDTVDNGQDALDYALLQHYDAIILDIMMPGMDGLTVVRELRQRGCGVPVLLLTAKSEVEDRITGLDAGADDYLPKPFAMNELLARVRALLRRRENYIPDTVKAGDLALDQARACLCCGEKTEPLSKLEYQLMDLFIRHPGMVFSTQQLLQEVWGTESEADVGAVWVYISYLRKKLTGIGSRMNLRCKRGLGYLLEEKA